MRSSALFSKRTSWAQASRAPSRSRRSRSESDGGGLRPGDLVLVGGAQAVGKTTLTLQMARNLAAQGNVACTFVCYEHDELYLLQRLLALEAFLARDQTGGDSFSLSELRDALLT